MKSLEDIKKVLSSHKKVLSKKYPIKSIAIFGSYARNENHNNSDIDLMVEFNGKIGIQFIDLAEELEKLLNYKVDLVSKKGIKEKYFQAIKSDLVYV
jgi:predicted nucleotidyltransferase